MTSAPPWATLTVIARSGCDEATQVGVGQKRDAPENCWIGALAARVRLC